MYPCLHGSSPRNKKRTCRVEALSLEGDCFPSLSKLKVTLLEGDGCGVRYVLVLELKRLWIGEGFEGCRTVGADPLLLERVLERRRFLRITVAVLVNIVHTCNGKITIKTST